ncbi:MAG: hypothetical protein ACYTA3_05095 [Planctomycetota bacterium]|jgi:hypothetical protein
MKHRLPTIAICLLLGVLVNVSVAWACAYWVAFGPLEARQYERNHGGPWSILSWAGFGSRRIVSIRPRSTSEDADFADGWRPTPPAWSGIRPGRKPPVGSSVLLEAAEARGWPFLSLSASFEAGSPPRSFHTRVSLGGVEIRPAAHRRNVYDASGCTLPLRPVWRGFIANTLLYAAAAWLLSRLPGVRRRRIRRRQGLCPSCGYPPGASAVCTECGAALGVSLVSATDDDGAIR